MKWINVREKVPDTDEYVAILTADADTGEIHPDPGIGHFKDGAWYCYDILLDEDYARVAFWMPLPPIPVECGERAA